MAITAIADGIALYRVFGEADLLLYVGISNSFGRRWREHAKKQPWWGEMRRLTVDCWYPSRAEAEEAETAAIKADTPKYNKKNAGSKASNHQDENDYDTIVKQSSQAIHAIWHDGYSRGRALQEATGRYGRLRGCKPQWMLTQEAQRAVQNNWGPRNACLLCQQGFTRIELPLPVLTGQT
jgi:hypothetical protein